MHKTRSSGEERIAVLYPSGRQCGTVSVREARQKIRDGIARAPRTGKRFSAIILEEGPSRPVAGTKYSHRTERDDNPRNVWALRHLPINHEDPETRKHVFLCFRAALVECGAEVRNGIG